MTNALGRQEKRATQLKEKFKQLKKDTGAGGDGDDDDLDEEEGNE